jgi:hypothetical protein
MNSLSRFAFELAIIRASRAERSLVASLSIIGTYLKKSVNAKRALGGTLSPLSPVMSPVSPRL